MMHAWQACDIPIDIFLPFLSAFTLSFFSLALQLTLAVAFAFGLPLGLAAFLLDRGFLFFWGGGSSGSLPKTSPDKPSSMSEPRSSEASAHLFLSGRRYERTCETSWVITTEKTVRSQLVGQSCPDLFLCPFPSDSLSLSLCPFPSPLCASPWHQHAWAGSYE